MSFLEERQSAQQALDSDDPDVGVFPPVARRIRVAREAAGLTREQVAQRLGMELSAYMDVEFHDDELFSVVDFETVPSLACLLGLPPLVMLFGEEPPFDIPAVAPSDVAVALAGRMESEGLTLDQLSEEVGWDLGPVLRDPETIWTDFPVLGMNDLCNALGLDWVGLLVESAAGRPTSAST